MFNKEFKVIGNSKDCKDIYDIVSKYAEGDIEVKFATAYCGLYFDCNILRRRKLRKELQQKFSYLI